MFLDFIIDLFLVGWTVFAVSCFVRTSLSIEIFVFKLPTWISTSEEAFGSFSTVPVLPRGITYTCIPTFISSGVKLPFWFLLFIEKSFILSFTLLFKSYISWTEALLFFFERLFISFIICVASSWTSNNMSLASFFAFSTIRIAFSSYSE